MSKPQVTAISDPEKAVKSSSRPSGINMELTKQESYSELPKNQSKGSIFSIRDFEVKAFQSEVDYEDDHLLPKEKLFAKYEVNMEHGMTSKNAEWRLEEDGQNTLPVGDKRTVCNMFVSNVFLGFNMLLWIGALLSLIGYVAMVIVSGEHATDHLKLSIILSIVVTATGLFGFYNDYKAANVTDAFGNMVPQLARVLRDGHMHTIHVADIVRGDIVKVGIGEVIPADIIILESNDMQVDNSSMTGESEMVARSSKATNRNPLESENVGFFTSFCTQGECVGIVVATGADTMIGHIAVLAKGTAKEMPPISKELHHFIVVITFIATITGITFFILALTVSDYTLIDAVILMLSIMIANVPEGIMVTVTAALTLTIHKMAQKNCMVKEMSAVETLGCTSMICSDKTGTLTQNKMRVESVDYNNSTLIVHILEMQECTDGTFLSLCRAATLCLRAVYDDNTKDDNNRKIKGDASETAILRFVEDVTAYDTTQYRMEHSKIFEIPFNSSNKYQVSIHKFENEFSLLVMKGAPEIIHWYCSSYMFNGETLPMTEAYRNEIFCRAEDMASTGQRVLGFADLEMKPEFDESFKFTTTPLNFPLKSLRWLGLVGIIDPPRPGVREAVHICQNAGIRVAMVTGDHPITALAIAREVGIISKNAVTKYDKAIENTKITASIVTGDDLRQMDDEEIQQMFVDYDELVFARTSPQQKLRIVAAAQYIGHIVAVTGDGVNDSPALKKANCGLAMGIAGTDVSKQAADIILLDDNFATIVNGIEEGRLIYENLKKSVAYTLTSNIAELTPFLIHVIISIPLPLSVIYILLIDLGTDVWPAISLAYERSESDIMNYPPRDLFVDRLVNLKLVLFSYGLVGCIQASAGLSNYFLVMGSYGFLPKDLLYVHKDWENSDVTTITDSYGYPWSHEDRIKLKKEAQTAYFIAIIVTQVADALISKTRRISIFQQGMKNWFLNVGLIFEVTLAALVTYTPFGNTLFGAAPVQYYWWFTGLPFCFLLLIGDEIRKYMVRNYPGGWVERNTYY